MMRRFGALRGFPVVVNSDPGSQLENAAGSLESWFKEMKNQLDSFAYDTLDSHYLVNFSKMCPGHRI